MATAAIKNYLGRCKTCDYVIFATSEDVKDAENFKAVTAGTGVYKVGNNGHFARCTNRHKFFAVKRVKGTYSESHECDSRCLNAKGWSCTCSCGGANHGRGHVATIVQAAELAERPRRSAVHPSSGADTTGTTAGAKHLGEVGKHIVGKVRVVFVKDFSGPGGDSTLYAFRTIEGDNIIKWFAPSYANPEWEVGYTFTLRAKVKAHNVYGEQPETQVTYVEEVQ